MRFKRSFWIFLVNLGFFGLLLTARSVLAAPGTSSMVDYLKLDETSAGSTAADSSGYANSLTPSGAAGANNNPQPSTSVPYTTFPDTRSLNFDGTDDLLSKTSPAFNTATSPRSISVWIYSTSHAIVRVPIAYGICAAAGAGHDGQAFGFYVDTADDVHFWGCGSGDFDTGATITDNAWYHIAVTYDGTNVKVYKNGTQIGATTARTLVAPTATTYFQVGGVPNIDSVGRYWTGNMDDVRIYNRALSQTEITDLAKGNHTTATWTGSSSTAFETAGNWDINAVPEPYTKFVIASTVNSPSLSVNEQYGGLTINSGGNLNLAGFNFTANDTGTTSGLATNSGTLTLQGGETLSNFQYSNATSAGTVLFNGTGTYASLASGNNYYNLTFNGVGSWTLGNALTINNNFTITTGTVSTAGKNISVAGNWSNSGTFTPSTGTVTLSGTDQTLSGTTTFYNLTKTVVASATLTFPASLTTTVTNTLNLQGAAGNLLALRSSTSGTQFKIDPQGTRTFSYLNPQDSNNVNATAIAYDSTFSYGSNLTNWTQPTPTPTPTPTTAPASSSGTSSASCTATAPTGTPNLYQIDPSKNSVTLYFTPVSGADSYYISYGTNSSANQFATSFSDTDTSGAVAYTINDLQPGMTYYFQVRGGNSCATGNWSNTKSSATLAPPANSTALSNIVESVRQAILPPKKLSITSSRLSAQKSNVCSYTVLAGDSYWSIAREKLGDGAKYAVLQNINKNKNLHPGNQIELPCDKSPGTVAKAEKEAVQSGVSLAVKVLGTDSRPVVGAVVTLHSKVQVAKTDENGIARFRDVQSGEHKILLAYSGYTGSENLKIDGTKKQQTMTIRIELNGISPLLVYSLVSILCLLVITLSIALFITKRRRKEPESMAKS